MHITAFMAQNVRVCCGEFGAYAYPFAQPSWLMAVLDQLCDVLLAGLWIVRILGPFQLQARLQTRQPISF